MKNLSVLDWVAIVLVIVGAVNWGLVGALSFDLVKAIFGDMTALSRIVYVLVGLAGIWMIFISSKCCKSSSSMPTM